ncbi:hypothetical protein J2799_000972 [Chryseobacterium vietnamense]|uniref:super-infection exclusion protein B n=1 Tax=Chryseobacterium vietnamense TaxID=866785 RepID=UPI002862B416|nr:super-infection exclusion protein B [Chryseobacterium vietnamense]MDR6486487.1 hypothetical protein [Chryseobacterium vietnamense]
MEAFILKFFDWDKIPMKLIFLIFIVSCVLTLVPVQYLEYLKIAKFNKEYGQYSGVFLLGSFAFLIVSLVSYFIRKYNVNRQNKAFVRKVQLEMFGLTNPEKMLIAYIAGTGRKTINLPAMNPNVVALENKLIIYKSSSSGQGGIRGLFWTYTISEHAIPYISEHVLASLEKLRKENPEYIEQLKYDIEEYKNAP